MKRSTVMAIAAVIAAVIAGAGSARAGTRRFAVVSGNNAGSDTRAPLHYAEVDAEKFARVLRELGGVEPDDLVLLEGKSAAALSDAFARVARRVAAARKDPTTRIVVMFYFSGHSDGEALELGRDRVTFAELRRALASVGADVRVALVDSCKSGALLEVKGGRPGPGFQIRMTDELASTGEVLLTSSAADEVALESREIGGSFFTHHFVSGLRGAADESGDGRVTLNEAYQYAYAHTIAATGQTVIGMQHPGYDYRLSGQGELVLAEVSKRTAQLVLPGGFERIIVIDAAREQVVAEVTSKAAAAIAVPPGRYAIRAARAGAVYAGSVAVTESNRREVRGDELSLAPMLAMTIKGGEPASGWGLLVSGGVATGVADHLGPVPGGRVALVAPSGLSLAVIAGSRGGDGYRETSARILAGYRLQWTWGAWSMWGGVEAGGGAVMQSVKPAGYSSVLAAGALVGIGYDVERDVSIAVEGTLDGELLKRDGDVAVRPAPAVWFGVVIRR